jgi:hypothetical protein
MKVYEVECGAVIRLTAQDMQKAALHGAALIKDNLHLIYVKAVHERNFEPAWEASSAKNSQKDSIFATLPTCPTLEQSEFLKPRSAICGTERR